MNHQRSSPNTYPHPAPTSPTSTLTNEGNVKNGDARSVGGRYSLRIRRSYEDLHLIEHQLRLRNRAERRRETSILSIPSERLPPQLREAQGYENALHGEENEEDGGFFLVPPKRSRDYYFVLAAFASTEKR